jgi:hypothetical protein
VANPPTGVAGLRGWPNHLLLKKKKEKVKEKEEQWVPDPPTRGGWPPLRPWGWLNHPLLKKKKT